MRISDWSSDVCSSDLILPALRERELGLLLPALLGLAEAGEATRGLLPLGDRLVRGRPHLHQGVLHLLDHQADDLLRLFGTVEDGIEVGIDDVGEAGDDTPRSVPYHCLSRLLAALRAGREEAGVCFLA